VTVSAAALTVRALGLVPYREGLRLQDECVRARADGETGDTLLLLEHPPVLTAGRGTGEGSLKADAATLARTGLEVVPVSRGGDVTWHGPGQLVGYPVCDLAARGHDLHRFLRGLEQGLLDALGRWGIDAHRSEGRTGVWVGERKLASIGIAVRRWVSYHGFALNVRPDLGHFDLIHPCGLKGVRMTSMAELLGGACPSWTEVLAAVSADVAAALGYDTVRGSVMPARLEDARWSDAALGNEHRGAGVERPLADAADAHETDRAAHRTGGHAA
jgi:lipoate-protein ligase B